MRPVRRRVRRLLIGLVVLLSLVVIGGGIFLQTPAAARLVAHSLSQQFGTVVEIDGIAIGWASTTFTGLRIHEKDAAAGDPPLLTATRGQVDIGVANALTGSLDPTSLTFDDPKVLLRVGRDGKPTTRFPTPTATGDSPPPPSISITNGTLTLRQEGKDELLVGNIQAKGERVESGDYHLAAKGDHPRWGEWLADIRAGAVEPKLELHIRNAEPVASSSAEVVSLPFVDPQWLRDYPVNGSASVDIRLSFDPDFRYGVEVRLSDAVGRVVPAQVDFTHGSGRIAIDNGEIQLRDMVGRAADGEVRLRGDVNLNRRTVPVDLMITATGMDVTRLPRAWGLDKYADAGRLSGTANVHLAVSPEGMRTDGTGKLTITNARVLGAEATGPVEITLRPSANGFQLVPQGGVTRKRSSRGIAAVYDLERTILRSVLGRPFAEAGRVKVRFDLVDVDICEFLGRLGVDLPFLIQGDVSFGVEVELPTDHFEDLREYRFRGTIESRHLMIQGAHLERLKAQVVYRDGVVQLTECSGQVPQSLGGGSFRGTARMEVIPPGQLQATLIVNGVSLHGLIPDERFGLSGRISGQATVSVPTDGLDEPRAWAGTANLGAVDVSGFGLVVDEVRAAFALKAGQLVLSRVTGKLEGGTLRGDGMLRLEAPYRFEAEGQLAGFDLASLNRLMPQFRPPVEVAGALTVDARASGDLASQTFAISGSSNWRDVKVADVPVERLQFHWTIDTDCVRLDAIEATVGGGKVTGDVVVPGQASLSFQQVQLKPLTRDVAILSESPLEGTVAGTLHADIRQPLTESTVQIELTPTQFRIRNIPIERGRVALRIADNMVGYRLTGESFGGTVAFEGDWPYRSEAISDAPEPPTAHRVRIENVRLEGLLDSQGWDRQQMPLRGRASLTLDLGLQPLSGIGRIRVKGFGWGDQELAAVVQTDLRVNAREVRLRNISASLFQGTLSGQVGVNLANLDRSWLRLSIDQISANALLMPFAPDLARSVDARLSVSVQSHIGRNFRGSAMIAMGHGIIFGIPVGDARIPIDWEIVPALRRAQFNARDFSARIATGRVSGTASYLFGPEGTNLEGEATFNGVDVGEVVAGLREIPFVGVGRATGRVTFAGRNVQTLSDLTARLRAKFGPSEPFKLPVLEKVVPFLGRPANVSVSQSELHASLARGIVRVERLALKGNAVSLFASGSVTLQGRLDLDVVASSGPVGIDARIAKVAGLDIPLLLGPMPIAMALRASQFLANRTLHLHVGGGIRSPTITINPVRILAEEAIRFFFGIDPLPDQG